jgi:hypothetical protein
LTSIDHQLGDLSTALHAQSFAFEPLEKKNWKRRETISKHKLRSQRPHRQAQETMVRCTQLKTLQRFPKTFSLFNLTQDRGILLRMLTNDLVKRDAVGTCGLFFLGICSFFFQKKKIQKALRSILHARHAGQTWSDVSERTV